MDLSPKRFLSHANFRHRASKIRRMKKSPRINPHGTNTSRGECHDKYLSTNYRITGI